ncbi:hypothetical protein D3C74_442500 [compost metagenome]
MGIGAPPVIDALYFDGYGELFNACTGLFVQYYAAAAAVPDDGAESAGAGTGTGCKGCNGSPRRLGQGAA